ncbi:MAG: hypothetical protein U0401_26400 [Anaerolineae bacterium]
MPPEFDLHQHKRLAIRAGFVHFFRFVSSKGTFSLLNETWTRIKTAGLALRFGQPLTRKLNNSTSITATKVDYCQLIAQFDYPVAEEVVALDLAYIKIRPSVGLPLSKSFAS